MYTLHIANKNYSSWSLRPWLLLTAFDIPFTEKIHPFPETNTWDLYRTFSPSGKVPCLQDGDLCVWDSLAIVEYLSEQHVHVWPSHKPARTWARCAATEMHAGFQALRSTCGMNCGLRIRMNNISPALQKDIDRIDELWNEGLQKFGGPFLAGDKFSAVDAFFAPVVFRVQTYNLPISKNAQEYIKTMLEFPALKKWYQEALLETWREPGHEQDALSVGKVLTDFRTR